MEYREVKFSENLRRIRRERGYGSGRELAAALQQVGYFCSTSTVKSWETGHRNATLDAVAALCTLFNVTADELIF